MAAIALVAAVGAYAYATTRPPVYKASGRMFLSADVANGQDPTRLVDTQAQLATSTPVLVEMSKRLSLPVEVVQKRLTVIPADKGDYFTIAGTGATPAAAVEVVTAAQRAYQQAVTGEQERDRQGALNDLVEERADLERTYDEARAKLDKTPDDVRLQVRVDTFAEQLKALRKRISDSVATSPARSPVQFVETPQLPTAPASPKPLWIGVVGLLLGAILGVALVWWRSERVVTDAQPASPTGPDEDRGQPNLSGSPQWGRRRAAPAEQRGGAAMAAASELDRPDNGPAAPRLSPAAPWEPARRLDNGSASAAPPPEPPMHRARRAFNPLSSPPTRAPEVGEAEARGEEARDAAARMAGVPTLTTELSVAFDRLSNSLQDVMETLQLDGWSTAKQSLPQVEAEKAALYFGLGVAVILLDDGGGRLEVAGEVGLSPMERKAIRRDADLWRKVLSARPRVMEEEDRARFAEAGIVGVGETVLMIPLVYEDVGFGLLLASERADGEEPAAFDEWKIQSMAAYAHVIEPALWSWVLLGRLKLRLGGER